jgi:hypothetical protein
MTLAYRRRKLLEAERALDVVRGLARVHGLQVDTEKDTVKVAEA